VDLKSIKPDISHNFTIIMKINEEFQNFSLIEEPTTYYCVH
jgi:hypothetical protein